MKKPLLEVFSLGKIYETHWAIRDLSFSIEPGKIYGFLGPNGAGKTTTLKIIATLELPTEGDAFIDGISILKNPVAARTKIGFMPDHFIPYPNLTVRQYLDFSARTYSITGRKRLSLIEQIIEFCGLESFEDRFITKLSKGMGQRVHLAKTLIHDPMLLLLDEPANGLDPKARIEFRDLLKELANVGKTILISSHILSELSGICHGVVLLEQGKKVTAGTIEEVSERLKTHLVVQIRVLSAINETISFLLTQPHINEIRNLEKHIEFNYTGEESDLAELIERILFAKIKLVEVTQRKPNLEDIFMRHSQGKLQ